LSDAIQETIDTLNELKRLHQLNFELLEQLNVVCQWMLDNYIHVPDEEKMRSLLGKSLTLLREIQADTPQIILYQKLADKKKQTYGTDEEEPEPFMLMKPCSVLRHCLWNFGFLGCLVVV
jgi:hypothetical protein